MPARSPSRSPSRDQAPSTGPPSTASSAQDFRPARWTTHSPGSPNAKVEDLQLPFAQHGVSLVMDYGIDQKGKQAFWASPDGKHDLVMCDGSWYLASMPETLQLAEKTYADAKKAATDNIERGRS
jgi:hypothetical protein